MINKKLNVCLIVVLLFIIICFFWNESLSSTKQINYEKFNSFFTSAGVLITAYSLLIIYLQLKESKKQNDFASQPQLFIENKSYEIKDYGGSSLAKSYINIKVPEGILRDEWGIKVVNVGNGTALKIEVSWIFNVDEVKSLTEQYYSSRIEKISKYKFFKDYMKTDEFLYIGLPFIYLNLFGNKLNSELNTNKNDESNRPALRVKINYTDIQNIPFERCFKVINKLNKPFLTFDFNIEQSCKDT